MQERIPNKPRQVYRLFQLSESANRVLFNLYNGLGAGAISGLVVNVISHSGPSKIEQGMLLGAGIGATKGGFEVYKARKIK